MTRRNPPAKWVLPDVVNPPDSLCFQVQVPNEKFHIAAFKGALYALSSARFWQDDPAHTALQVAKIWQEIYDKISQVDCNPKTVPTGTSVELPGMSELIQVICNDAGDCILQYRCDVCSDWITAANLSQVNKPANTGPDNPQPGAGKCMTYHGRLDGNAAYLMPAIVNTGDVITFSNFNGSTSATNGLFYCANGQELFLTCFGTPPAGGGSDIDASHPHYGLIVTIGSNHYLASAGPITVPGGVANAQVTLRINSVATDILGAGFSFDVEDCNNQTASFTHVFDFSINDGGWIIAPTRVGSWSPGVGWITDWQFDGAGASARFVSITKAFGSRTITSFAMTYNFTNGTETILEDGTTLWNGTISGSPIASAGHANGTNLVVGGPMSPFTSVRLSADVTCGNLSGNADPGGSATITKIVISGIGTDPF